MCLLAVTGLGLSPALYSPNVVEKLSEKGYQQHSERGIGRRKEAKMGRKVPLRCSVRLPRRLLRPFSDSFRRGILRTAPERSSPKFSLGIQSVGASEG